MLLYNILRDNEICDMYYDFGKAYDLPGMISPFDIIIFTSKGVFPLKPNFLASAIFGKSIQDMEIIFYMITR